MLNKYSHTCLWNRWPTRQRFKIGAARCLWEQRRDGFGLHFGILLRARSAHSLRILHIFAFVVNYVGLFCGHMFWGWYWRVPLLNEKKIFLHRRSHHLLHPPSPQSPVAHIPNNLGWPPWSLTHIPNNVGWHPRSLTHIPNNLGWPPWSLTHIPNNVGWHPRSLTHPYLAKILFTFEKGRWGKGCTPIVIPPPPICLGWGV